MSSLQQLQQPNAASVATNLSQGTAIEQSRAAAEVYGAMIAAKQAPRDEQAAIRAMTQACGLRSLAERAFYRFNRGGQAVTGPTVQLARELVRCWGNVQYGVTELSRDDAAGQSEMQAFAWDMETNTRNAAVFIVPHRRDKKSGSERITDARDLYEMNANAGARRVRECIFAVLPMWFTEQAQELCHATLKTDTNGDPLPQRIAKSIDTFRKTHGITEDQLVAKVGRPTAKWDETDLAQLGVTYRSIERGEIDKDTEFPPVRVSAAEITGPKQAPATAEPAEVVDDGEQGFLPDDPDLTAHLEQ